jgi:hypothetical protein
MGSGFLGSHVLLEVFIEVYVGIELPFHKERR